MKKGFRLATYAQTKYPVTDIKHHLIITYDNHTLLRQIMNTIGAITSGTNTASRYLHHASGTPITILAHTSE